MDWKRLVPALPLFVLAAMPLALIVSPAFAESERSANSNNTSYSSADALLAIDQHRPTVVERIVVEWADKLVASGAGVTGEQLREMLLAMRADQLLAASLAGSLSGLRDVLAHALTSRVAVKPGLLQAKALGDSADDVVYTPVTPCRLVETRGTFAAVYQGGGAFSGGAVRNYTIQGGNGVCLTQLPSGLHPSAVQLQVFGIPINSGSNGDIEILPQGSSFGSTATEVYVGNVLFNTVSTTAKINPANNQIGVQVRGGGAHVAIDVVGYFKRPGNYGGTHVITGQYATDSGGNDNTSSGDSSTVAGGETNTASGSLSFAAGTHAQAIHDHSFVWGGDPLHDSLSQANGDFVVVAPGVIRMYGGPFGSGGCLLSNGTAGWQCASDRNLKENFVEVDGREVLRRVSELPITEWNSRAVPAVRHIGPMAQDFYALFGVGEDDVHIGTTDAQGVALAAIQGLNKVIQEKDSRIAALERQVSELHSLRDELTVLKAMVAELAGQTKVVHTEVSR